MKKRLLGALAALALFAVPAFAQFQSGSRAGGRYNASFYNYGSGTVAGAFVTSGNQATGSQTITVCFGGPGPSLADGRQIQPFATNAPITIDPMSPTNVETVTPTAVSTFYGSQLAGGQSLCANITASFSFTHGNSLSPYQVASGSYGLQEAVNDAFAAGGGTVVVDHSWGGGSVALDTFPSRPSTTNVSTTPYPSVSIEDTRFGAVQFWNAGQSSATVIAAPATLTATTVGFAINGANSTSGTYVGANTYHYAIACVDVMGNESQPSADFSGATAGTGSTNQIGFSAPAAQTGCVGWVPYISLTGGTYALSYRVPVATFTAGVPVPNGVCTLNVMLAQIGIAACNITNSTYGTTGSNAIVSALTVNTARIWVGVGGASTTADVVGNSNARQSYAYVPGSRMGMPGITNYSLAFSAATGPLTAAPAVIATIQLPAGFMNHVSKGIRVCANVTSQGGSTATVDVVEAYFDADGSNTAGAGVILPAAKITNTLSATPAIMFCQNFTATVSGTSATAGTIFVNQGYLSETMSVAATTAANFFTVPNIVVAGSTVASLNLAGEARLDLAILHTTGTDGTWTANNVTVEPLD